MNMKTWEVLPLNKDAAAEIAETYGVPFFLAMLLEIRGIREPEQIRGLLQSEACRFDPFSLLDMDRAAGRIRAAVDGFERIAVYGDYDADGVTATAMLYSYLESSGADVQYYIPDREQEGYGLNRAAIDLLKGRGVKLIVTVDNGISSIPEVSYAKELGVDVVITDHHRPQKELPAAAAVVDPYREGCPSPFKGFSGVGVAFQLIRALEGPEADDGALLENYADLVAVGTVADVVPLVGENRALVQEGLRMLSHTDRIGMQALLERAGMEGKALTSESVAFSVVPRINATGRIGSPARAVSLLITEDADEADHLSREICEDNEFRRQIENEIFEDAVALLERDPACALDRVLVLSGKDWHPGVIGIVASRLVERFGKPCLVLSEDETLAKGSGRSVEGFSLFDAVSSCGSYLIKYGGHPMAAGFTLETANIEPFRREINRYAAEHFRRMPVPQVVLDCKLNPAALSVEMPESLKALEPFGAGNPQPVFGLYRMTLEEIIPVGNGKHLRLMCSRDGRQVRCMKFHMTAEEFPYFPGDVLDLAVTLETNEFRGEVSLSVFIREMRLSGLDQEDLLEGRRLYETYCRGEPLEETERAALLPDRDAFAAVYRYLRARKGWQKGEESLYGHVGTPFGYGRFLLMLDVLAERGLITCRRSGDLLSVSLCPVNHKVDLFASPLLAGIQAPGKGGV